MLRTGILLFVMFAATALPAQPRIPVLSFDELDKLMNQPNDTLYVFNFWATWCAPCIKELPHFDSLGRRYAGQKLKVVLVSLDFEDELETKLRPFAQKRKLRSTVVLLNPGRGGEWIDRVSPAWSGAIPATVFVRGSSATRDFYEKQFEFAELNTIVQQILGEQE